MVLASFGEGGRRCVEGCSSVGLKALPYQTTWRARLFTLRAQVRCCLIYKRRNHWRVLSMADQGSRSIAWFKEEYCFSIYLIWGIVKSEAFQYWLWKPLICRDLLSLLSDAQVSSQYTTQKMQVRDTTSGICEPWLDPSKCWSSESAQRSASVSLLTRGSKRRHEDQLLPTDYP